MPIIGAMGIRNPDGARRAVGESFELVLDAAQLGAGWARTRLYHLLAGGVTGYLRAQGVREPEDMTSDVFLAVFTRLGAFSGTEAQFRSWVFTIAHHKMVDERRRRARRPDPEPFELAGESGGGRAAAPAEDEAFANFGAERVGAMLHGLTAEQRDVISLRVLADLSVEQVAAMLGKPPGAVKALQRRALDALRRQLQQEGVSK